MLKQTERKKVSYFSKKKKNHFINVKSYINIKLLEGKQKPGFITFFVNSNSLVDKLV